MATSTVLVECPKTLTVTFGGELADRFCSTFEWCRQGLTDQIPDAVKTIAVNYPGLTSYLYKSTSVGQLFAVSIDDQWCADDLTFASYLGDAKTIHIEPLMSGAGGGNLLKGIIGVALIGVGIAAGSTGVLGIPGATLIAAGASMVLSAAGALFNRPIIKRDEEDDSRKSSYFSGSSQNATPGMTIPELYGTSVDEIPGMFTGVNALPIGRCIPVYDLTSDINYVEVEEEDE